MPDPVTIEQAREVLEARRQWEQYVYGLLVPGADRDAQEKVVQAFTIAIAQMDRVRELAGLAKDLCLLCRKNMDHKERGQHATRLASEAGVSFSPLRGAALETTDG